MELRELACCGPVVSGRMEEMLGREHRRNLYERRGSSEQYKDKILKEER